MRQERAGIGTGIAVFVVLVLLAFGACLAIADDDDEDGMARVASRAEVEKSRKHDRDRDECRRDCTRSGDGDRKGNRYCVMPCDFVIIVPVPTPGQDEAPPEREESALPAPDPRCAPFHCDPTPMSLVPPDPAKLVEAIRAMTQGIGEASGALAGAIAGGTIGILL